VIPGLRRQQAEGGTHEFQILFREFRFLYRAIPDDPPPSPGIRENVEIAVHRQPEGLGRRAVYANCGEALFRRS
jgi:hypothetical protein